MLTVLQPEEVQVIVCQWKIDFVRNLARGHLCDILAKNLSYSAFSLKYWIGQKSKNYVLICIFLFYLHVFLHFSHLFIYSIYILIAIPSPFHITQSLIPDSFLSSQGGWEPLEYPPTMAYQVSAGLDTSFPTEVRQGSPVMETVCTDWNSLRDMPCSGCWGPHEDWAAHPLHIW